MCMETLKYNYLHAEEELKEAAGKAVADQYDREVTLKVMGKKADNILKNVKAMHEVIVGPNTFYKLGETMEQRKLRCHT